MITSTMFPIRCFLLRWKQSTRLAIDPWQFPVEIEGFTLQNTVIYGQISITHVDLTNFEHGFDQNFYGESNGIQWRIFLRWDYRRDLVHLGSANIFHRFGLIGVWLARFSVFGLGQGKKRSMRICWCDLLGTSWLVVMWGCDHWIHGTWTIDMFDLWVFEMNQI